MSGTITTIKNDTCTKIINEYTISIDVENIEKAKELFECCKYSDAEQMFLRMKGSEAAAWRMLCYIMTCDIGKKGGKIATLLQESIKNQDVDIYETVASVKILLERYGGAIDRKTRNKAISSLQDAFDYIIRDRMVVAINDVNKKALNTIKRNRYFLPIYDDRAIPMKVLNNRMMKYKCRMRNYETNDIVEALKIINSDDFVQDVINDYLTMAQCKIVGSKFKDIIDTRDQDALIYIKSLYVSSIAQGRGLKFARSMNRSQLIDILNKLNQQGWLCVTMMSTENTKYFNMADNEEKAMCDIEIERIPAASVATSLEYEDITEKRGYLIRNNTVNQISKEDIVIGDVTDPYTYEYICPKQGTIYCEN